MATKKEVAKKGKTDVATLNFEDDADQGFENTTSDELSVPFLNLLQALSPQIDEEDPQYVEGAKAGLYYNTVSDELSKEIVFHAAAYQHVFVEWVPREAGGGFVAVHDRNSDTVKNAISANGGSAIDLKLGENDLIETYYLYAMIQDAEGDFGQVVVPFTSTKIKAFRDWLTRARQLMQPRANGKGKYRVPMAAVRYRLGIAKTENEKGKFYVPTIGFDKDPADPVSACMCQDSELYEAVKDFGESVNEGRAKADVESQSRGSAKEGDDEIPF
jgi:hypothetical protein